MRLVRIIHFGSLLGVLALASCGGGGSRRVTLLVTSNDRPVDRAHVRAIPLETSPVPLPLNSKTLPELKGVKGATACTDQEGRVTLSLAEARTFRVEVDAPMLGQGSDLESWHGVLDKNGGALVPLGSSRSGETTMRVELAR